MARSTEPVFKRAGRPFYYAWVPDPRTGRSVRKSTGCRTQGDAIAWRRRYLKADQDPAGEAARTVTLRDVLNDFLESRAAHTKNNGRPLSKDTLEFYQAKASMVAAVLGEDTLASRVDAAAIDAYLKARRSDLTQRGDRVTDHTISKELAVLRSALQRAKRLGKFFGDLDAVFPSTGEFAPGYDPRKSGAKALSREDVARLFAAAPREPAADAPALARETYRRTLGKLAVVAFGIACAAEFSALRRARWSDVSWYPGDPGRSVEFTCAGRRTSSGIASYPSLRSSKRSCSTSRFATHRAPAKILFPEPGQHPPRHAPGGRPRQREAFLAPHV